MTAEEIAAAVFEKQGFLVLGAHRPRKIGETIANPFSGLRPQEKIQVAMILVGEATAQEFDDQAELARIANVPNEGMTYSYYYRAIPGD